MRGPEVRRRVSIHSPPLFIFSACNTDHMSFSLRLDLHTSDLVTRSISNIAFSQAKDAHRMAFISSVPFIDLDFSVTSSPSIILKFCASNDRNPCSIILSTANLLLAFPCSSTSKRTSLANIFAASPILSPLSK